MPGRRLCLEEREEIRVGIERGESTRQIGGRLSRHHATIAREVAAGGGRELYRATAAQRRADAAARRPKPFKLATDRNLADRVTALVRDIRYSPPVCAQLLAKEGLRVSGETIYQACYQPGRGLAADLWMRLPRRRQRRKHAGRVWGATSADPLGDPTSIHLRPAAAADRTEPGHLEGDLIIGAHNRSAILTVCERVTRYTFLVALPDGYTAAHVAAALTALLTRIPAPLRRSLTWDQGREMRDWAQVQEATGTPIYFADPHAPWQRPTVENNNGLLRRWFPKGTSLNTYTQQDLDQVAELLNHMPRRIHNGASAADLYDQIVATTT